MPRSGRRLISATFMAGQVGMLDITNPRQFKQVSVVSFGKDTGPHSVHLTHDDKRLVVTDNFLNEDGFGKVRMEARLNASYYISASIVKTLSCSAIGRIAVPPTQMSSRIRWPKSAGFVADIPRALRGPRQDSNEIAEVGLRPKNTPNSEILATSSDSSGDRSISGSPKLSIV